MRDYEQIAQQYAHDILAETIPACKWVKGAAQRQVDDLERYADGDQFLWNPVLIKRGKEVQPVQDICAFIENLSHVDAQWAGTPIILEPWQIFILSCVFGWTGTDGLRRFREVYLEVPRKNGKSLMLSAIGLYMLLADDEAGAQVVSAARQRDQARVVWDISRRMVVAEPELQSAFGVTAQKLSVFVESTGSSFQALASDKDSLDGKSISCALVDELHAHRDRGTYDVLDSSSGARSQPIMFIITTAGSNQAGICYERREYTTKILDKSIPDDMATLSTFGIIYTIDSDDIDNVWNDVSLLQKANPNYGVSVLPFGIEKDWHKAKKTPAAQNEFLTKRLNLWVNADVAWMQMHRWDSCKDESLRLEDFEGEDCIMGGDFASKVDIASICLLFERGGHLYPFFNHYLPDETVRTSSNDLYSGWWRNGSLTVTEGQIVDFDKIQQDCIDFASRFQIKEFAYDPHQATQFAGNMINQGFNMIEVRPLVLNFSEPMKELEARVLANTISHNDEIMTWMISNVVGKYDHKQNIYPRKQRPENKIDGVIALLSAMNRYMTPSEDNTSIYDKRGLRVI